MTEASVTDLDRRFAVGAWCALVAFGAAIPLLVAQRGHALGIPRSDDWSYLRVLFVRDATGRWDFNDWVAQTLVGQIVLTQPVVGLFGRSITAVRVFIAIVGVGGLAATVALGRRLRLARGAALLVAVTVAVGPLWGPLAASYMTDLPGFAFQMLALAAAARALDPHFSRTWFAVAVGCALAAFSIRQYGAITLVAVLGVGIFAGWSRRDSATLRFTLLAAATATVAAVVFYSWWSTIPEELLRPDPPDGAAMRLALKNTAGFLRIAGLMLLPVLVLADPRTIAKRAWAAHRPTAIIAATISAGLLAAGYLAGTSEPFVGNYFDRRGTLADDIVRLGRRPEIMPRPFFSVLVLVGSLGGILLTLSVVAPLVKTVRRGISARTASAMNPLHLLLGLHCIGLVVAFVLATLFGYPVFDRYALPLLAPIGLLLLSAGPGHGEKATVAPQRGIRPVAGIAVLALAILGLGYSTESAGFDSARWRVSELAVANGFPARSISPGYEWQGFLFGRAPSWLDDPPQRGARLRRAYYEGVCVEAVVGPKRPPKDAIAFVVSDGWWRAPIRIYAARVNDNCAPDEAPSMQP